MKIRTRLFCKNFLSYRPVNHSPTVQMNQNVRRKIPNFLFRQPIPYVLWTSLKDIGDTHEMVNRLPESKDGL